MFYFFDIGQSRNVPTNLTNVPQYKISRKTVHWQPSFSMPLDRQSQTWRSWGQWYNLAISRTLTFTWTQT